MNIASVNSVSFGYRTPANPIPNYVNIRSLINNSRIPSFDIWKDLAEYRATQPQLTKRCLTKAEKETFIHLPNSEVKKMYLDKILTPLKRGRKIKIK